MKSFNTEERLEGVWITGFFKLWPSNALRTLDTPHTLPRNHFYICSCNKTYLPYAFATLLSSRKGSSEKSKCQIKKGWARPPSSREQCCWKQSNGVILCLQMSAQRVLLLVTDVLLAAKARENYRLSILGPGPEKADEFALVRDALMSVHRCLCPGGHQICRHGKISLEPC